jgi:hypothetical protein
MIDIQKLSDNVDIVTWEAAAIRASARNGFKEVKSFNVDTASFSTACIQRQQDDNLDIMLTVAYCKSSSGLVTQYFGDQNDVVSLREILYNIVQK